MSSIKQRKFSPISLDAWWRHQMISKAPFYSKFLLCCVVHFCIFISRLRSLCIPSKDREHNNLPLLFSSVLCPHSDVCTPTKGLKHSYGLQDPLWSGPLSLIPSFILLVLLLTLRTSKSSFYELYGSHLLCPLLISVPSFWNTLFLPSCAILPHKLTWSFESDH